MTLMTTDAEAILREAILGKTAKQISLKYNMSIFKVLFIIEQLKVNALLPVNYKAEL